MKEIKKEKRETGKNICEIENRKRRGNQKYIALQEESRNLNNEDDGVVGFEYDPPLTLFPAIYPFSSILLFFI